ncbi:hypothetical protein PanWU01x14_092930, partial [Parasponia andersonii]
MWRARRDQKYKLCTYFKEIGKEQDRTKAKLPRHKEVKKQADWEYLCDLWSTPAFV